MTFEELKQKREYYKKSLEPKYRIEASEFVDEIEQRFIKDENTFYCDELNLVDYICEELEKRGHHYRWVNDSYFEFVLD